MGQMLRDLGQDLMALWGIIRAIRPESLALAGIFLTLLGLWVFAADRLPPAYLPSPAETGDALYDMLADPRGDYLKATGNTLWVVFTGLFLATLAGGLLTWLMGALPQLARVLGPVLDALGAIPNIALMPLFVALLGLGHEAKLAVVFLAAVVPVLIAGYAALRQIDPVYAEVAATLGASRLTAWRRVVWPMALPALTAGVRIGAVQGLSACIVAEIYTAMTGLGGLVVGYGSAFNMPRYFVVVITLALIGIALTTLLRRLETRMRRRLRIGSET